MQGPASGLRVGAFMGKSVLKLSFPPALIIIPIFFSDGADQIKMGWVFSSQTPPHKSGLCHCRALPQAANLAPLYLEFISVVMFAESKRKFPSNHIDKSIKRTPK